jgi:hypothetical protein
MIAGIDDLASTHTQSSILAILAILAIPGLAILDNLAARLYPVRQ